MTHSNTTFTFAFTFAFRSSGPGNRITKENMKIENPNTFSQSSQTKRPEGPLLLSRKSQTSAIQTSAIHASAIRPSVLRFLSPILCLLTLSASALQPFNPSAFCADAPAPAPKATAAYNSGDFKIAEAAWRKQIADAPADWAARHNLSLALAQQDRWAEAGAQAFAAFVQHPGEPAVLRNVLLTLSRAGYTPSAVAEVTRPGPVREIALRHSPAQWQCALGISVALAALTFAFVLLGVYGRRFRWLLAILAAVSFGCAVLGTTVSLLSLRAFGAARDARAVIVWRAGSLRSIPTVADTTQKTTPLAAGTVALSDKNFPGWVRLVFDDGQTGWVPVEDTVALWR